ncbi:MAG: hypothetical protein IIW81_00325, partial [Oscillospiraceae bacterium]|nr:hypothetical protein [Oscillospiraceae bacterium]
MSYSAEVYSGAKRIIDERRSAADRDANIKKADVYAKFPEVRNLDNQLMRKMANFTMLMLRSQSELDEVLSSMKAEIDSIQQKRAGILIANGLPADYLEPHYTCKKCDELGRKNGILC